MNEAFHIVGLLTFLFGVVFGNGQFVVRLHSYDNPSGTDYNGTCCDSDVLRCQLDKCDLKFDICVGRKREGFDCTYGTKQVIAQPDSNNIDFGESMILSFPITTSLRDPLYIKVNVTDQDTGGASVLVDTFHFVFNTAAFYNSSVIEYQDYLFTGDRSQLRSKLNLSVTSYCDQNYYGEGCDINCVAEGFSCNGYFKCGIRGQKICNPGWTGKDCDVQIPGGEGDCGFYKDSTELLPSLWGGIYTCPGRPSEKIQMNVTPRNKDEILTSAVLTFDGISVTASGCYGYRTLLIQGKPNQKNITDVKLHGIQPPTNLSSMAGELTLNGDRTCTVVLNLQKSYFNQCGSGTCVRYGQQKNEFYCCCDGEASSYCGSSTKMDQSSSSTSITTKKITTTPETNHRPRTHLTTTATKTTLKTTRQTPSRTTTASTKSTSTLQPIAAETLTKTTTTDQAITASTNTKATTRNTGPTSILTAVAQNPGTPLNLKPILSKLQDCNLYGRLYAILLFNTTNK